MGDFFASLFGGQNKTLNNTIGNAGSIQGFTQGVGERGTTDAMKYYHDILSGNTASAMAPYTQQLQDQTQAEKGANAEFHDRSGGGTAASAGADAANRATLASLLAKLRSGAAGSEAQIGQTATGQSLDANQQEAQQAQMRMQNWLNSILGKGISSGIGTLESFGLGKLPGA
jgi:hypothetical protein